MTKRKTIMTTSGGNPIGDNQNFLSADLGTRCRSKTINSFH